MSEEPVKLDETMDAKPYEPPKPQRNRRVLAACMAAGVLLVGTAALVVRPLCAEKPPDWETLNRMIQTHKAPVTSVTVEPGDWSEEVNGLRCKLVVTPQEDYYLNTSVIVRNVGKDAVVVFGRRWDICVQGRGAVTCGPSLPRGVSFFGEPMVVSPGEESTVAGRRWMRWPGACTLWASYQPVAHSRLGTQWQPNMMPPEQLTKLENERRKNPGLPLVPVWQGKIETPRARVTVERK